MSIEPIELRKGRAFQTHTQDPEPCDYWLLRDGEIRVIGRANG